MYVCISIWTLAISYLLYIMIYQLLLYTDTFYINQHLNVKILMLRNQLPIVGCLLYYSLTIKLHKPSANQFLLCTVMYKFF